MSQNIQKMVDDGALIALSPDSLQRMIDDAVDRASMRAAEQATTAMLARLGIEDNEDIKNIREAVSVGAFWRRFRQSFVDAVGRQIARAILWAVLAGAAVGVAMFVKHAGNIGNLFGKS